MSEGAGAATPAGRWVLLAYRLPRDPSTRRIAVWRRLERLGVARLGDGLVALPADARTREQIDWIAEEVVEAGGSATVWHAVPGSAAQEKAVAETMRAARAAEYERVLAHAREAAGLDDRERARLVRRLREELRRIGRRDFFAGAERDQARAAVEALAGRTIAGTPAKAAADRAATGRPAARRTS
jgi:hypothetical protein